MLRFPGSEFLPADSRWPTLSVLLFSTNLRLFVLGHLSSLIVFPLFLQASYLHRFCFSAIFMNIIIFSYSERYENPANTVNGCSPALLFFGDGIFVDAF